MPSLILVTIIASLCLALATIVFFQNPREKINRIFFILVFLVIVWLFSNYLQNEPLSPSLASLFLRIDFASASLLFYFFFLFTVNFQGNYLVPSTLKQALLFIPPLILSFLSFSDMIINQIGFENHIITFKTGLLFPVYLIFLVGYTSVGCGDLLLKYKKLKGIEQIQTLYVLLGFSISAFIALIINLFFQHLLPVDLFRIGNYGILFFIGFTTYAILRHHLLEIKVILTELFVGIIALLLLTQLLVSETFSEFLFKLTLFSSFLGFGYLLIKSVMQEIKRREELETLTYQLETVNVKLTMAYKELEKLDKAKSEFISIASHQLRTPLAAIKGYISMILDGVYGKPNEEAKKPLESIYQSNERLIRLVNDLLNLSRLDAGKIKFEPVPASLEKIVKDIVEELKLPIENKGLYIRMNRPKTPLPQITIDKDHIRQAILNIVDNAIKYTEKGGITIELLKVSNKAQIKISDTGEGVDEKELKNLFQMFSRAAAGIQFHTEGAGIGLYIAKKFIEMHKGRIYAESKGRGKGSTFYIELPIE
jgi:signal transduction histidine kinase